MAITSKIQSQYFANPQQLIRIAQEDPTPNRPTKRRGTPWTSEEHERFLHALEQFPSGPWKLIAAHVQTRTTRQTMTHAQKYREKIARHRRSSEQSEALLQFIPGCAESSIFLGEQQQQQHSAAAAASVVDNTRYALTGSAGATSGAANALETSHATRELSAYSAVDDMYDATIALLLESYEPLEVEEDDSFAADLERFAMELDGTDDLLWDVDVDALTHES